MWRIILPDATSVLDNETAKKSLGRYFAVAQDSLPAKFMIAKKLPAEFQETDSTEELWRQHAKLTKEFISTEREIDLRQQSLEQMPAPKRSYLDLKIEIACRVLSSCHFCARRCGVNRLGGKLGYCRCGSKIVVSSIFEHLGEEPELVPSGTIFTMGCTMRCKHCQNWTISQWMENGEAYEPERLAKEVKQLRMHGCRNINLVGGEPTPWLHQWLLVFKHVDVNVPVVWNSNSYYSEETASLLAGFADVYLLDFKYGIGTCAEKISEAPNYWQVSARNHLYAKKHGEPIIRLLVLPNHLECCTKPIVKWIAENMGAETRVNVMFQYRPEWRAYEVQELRRKLTGEEMEKAAQIAREAGLRNVVA